MDSMKSTIKSGMHNTPRKKTESRACRGGSRSILTNTVAELTRAVGSLLLNVTLHLVG
jgi:hypothetical protein